LKAEAINVPVKINSVDAAPGDIIAADGTGIVRLPGGRRGASVLRKGSRLPSRISRPV